MSANPQQVQEVLSLLESGLSYALPHQSRYRGQDALHLLRQGRLDAGYEALSDAAALSDGLGQRFLVEARSKLAPYRVASL